MTEQEKSNFLRYANRPGKRQVKPTNLFFEVAGEEDSENDEDFAFNGDVSDNDNSGSGSDDGSDPDESGSNDEEDDSRESVKVDEDESMMAEDKKEEKKAIELCCICLNPARSNMPLCKCDRCQIVVHESCYGIIDDDAESVSSGTDLPWFCEPCMFGLVEPPYCTMCPNRFGAFKKTDVGGNWIHLVCAHYIEKTTFADDDKFQGASYQEIDYKQFGRKPCNGCEDDLQARVGIVVQCESGLCKNYYHPTCAQKLGLLVPMEANETDGHLLCKKHSLSEDVKPRRKRFEVMMAHEVKRMIGIRRKRLGFGEERRRARQMEEYNRRMQALEGVNVLHPGPNNVKRQRMVNSSFEMVEGFALKAEMVLGLSKEEFVNQFKKVPPENLNLGTEMGLSEDFARYFEYRETVQFDECEQYIEELKENKEETLNLEKELIEELVDLRVSHKKCIESSTMVKDQAEKMYALLSSFDAKGISKAFLKLPKSFPQPPVVLPTSKKSAKKGKLSSSSSIKSEPKAPKAPAPKRKVVPDTVGMPILKRTPSKVDSDVITLSDDDDGPPNLTPSASPVKIPIKYAQPVAKKTKAADFLPKLTRVAPKNEVKSDIDLNASAPADLIPTPRPAKPKASLSSQPDVHKVCKTCNKDTNPELMPYCDSCRHFYHIGCLDPPLDKVPKISKFYKWSCSDCNEKECQELENGMDTEDSSKKENDQEGTTLAGSRRPRERALAIRVAREADLDESIPEIKRRRVGSDASSTKGRKSSKGSTRKSGTISAEPPASQDKSDNSLTLKQPKKPVEVALPKNEAVAAVNPVKTSKMPSILRSPPKSPKKDAEAANHISLSVHAQTNGCHVP